MGMKNFRHTPDTSRSVVSTMWVDVPVLSFPSPATLRVAFRSALAQKVSTS